MAPQEIPRFYLYSLGLPPAELTLGTLIFGNYAQPEGRCAVFQGQVSRIRSILRAAHVEISRVIEDDHVNRQEVSGCWTTKKESKYGLGIEAIAELASIGIEYVRSRKKVVFAESGSRLVLRDPERFLQERVLRSPEVRTKLALWLSAAKSTYLLRKATFRKPKIYCVTGLYELDGAYAWIDNGSETALSTSIDSATMGVASGIPIGLQLGPFAASDSLTCNMYLKGKHVWAARFHQLDVSYVRQGADMDAFIASHISLLYDVTIPGEAIMGSDSPINGKIVCQGDDSIEANGADVLMIGEIEELTDNESDEYWLALEEAMQELEGEADDRLEEESHQLLKS